MGCSIVKLRVCTGQSTAHMQTSLRSLGCAKTTECNALQALRCPGRTPNVCACHETPCPLGINTVVTKDSTLPLKHTHTHTDAHRKNMQVSIPGEWWVIISLQAFLPQLLHVLTGRRSNGWMRVAYAAQCNQTRSLQVPYLNSNLHSTHKCLTVLQQQASPAFQMRGVVFLKFPTRFSQQL